MKGGLFMKKLYYSLAALLFIAAGCSNDDFVDDKISSTQKKAITSVNALLEDADTRTQLVGKSVLWDNWDRIGVFSDLKTDLTEYAIKTGSGTSSASFTGERVEAQNLFYAIYPKNDIKMDAANKKVIFKNMDAHQIFIEGKDHHTIPMMAISQDENMKFQQLTGMLHFQVTGTSQVIGFGLNIDDSFGDSLVVSYATGEPVVAQTIQSLEGRDAHRYGSGIRYDKENPKQLSSTPTDVYIMLPPTLFKDGFSFFVERLDGWDDRNEPITTILRMPTTKEIDIKQGAMITMPVFNLDEELEKLEQEKAAEKAALQAIYTALKPADTTWQGWDFTKEPKSRWDADGWQGLIVEDGHVVELQLNNYEGMNVYGAMPKEIANLKHLRFLKIQSQWGDNSGITSLPDELANITSLKQIELANQKGLTVFPAVIGNMTQLEELIISNLPITTFPAAILQLTNLKHLTVQSCQMTGEFPMGVMNLPKLTNLTLGGNQFTGELTAAFFTNWPAMTVLALGGSNGLTGNISREVIQGPNWPAFENIDIGATGITLEGAVKSFDVNAEKEYEYSEKQRIKTLSVNEEFQIEVSNFKPADADNKEVAYRINGGANIVSVDANGKVKALRQGDAWINVYAKDHCGAWMEIHFRVQ